MITVKLNTVKFFAFHGLHEEEKVVGGEYELDIDVMFEEDVNLITDLQHTVNYGDLYDIASEQMKIASPLIETVAMKIGRAIYNKYSYLKRIAVTINKMHPPIMHMQGSVGVSWIKDY